MLPNMRSVVAQCYRGGRSISMGPRRNFSSSIESKKDWSNSLHREIAHGFPTWMAVGICLSCVWEMKTTTPKWKKIKEEQELLKQRHQELPLKALDEFRNKWISEKKFP